MTIDFGAFLNCISLEELHFEKCVDAVNTNIYKSNVLANMKIIVHDKMYLKFFNAEIPANRHRLQLYSEYILKKIDSISNSNVITSIIYLDDIANMLDDNYQIVIDAIANIRHYLICKYNVTIAIISYVQYLLHKKQEIQDEPQL